MSKGSTLTLREEINILRSITETIFYSEDLTALLNKVVEIISEFTKADSCLLYIIEGDGLVLMASKNPHPKMIGKIRLKTGEGITGWAAQQKEIVSIPKGANADHRFKYFKGLPEDKYEAFLAVPIIWKEKTVGVVSIQHRREHRYTKREIMLMSTIAQQVSGAIEHMRLYQQNQKKAKQLDALFKISDSISSNLYLKEILDLIITVTAQTIDSKICSIMLLDEKKQVLTIEATQSLSKLYLSKPPVKVGEGISGRAVLLKRPISVIDVTSEPNYKYPDIAKKEGIKSMLALPMMIKGRVVGVLNVYTEQEHVFTNDEIKTLQTVANQSAVAIENTRLIDDIQRAKEALETRKVLDKAKGILMKNEGMTEGDAHRFITKKSMDTGKALRQVAEAIILAYEIKG